MMHSFIVLTVFERLIGQQKATEILVYFRLMLQKNDFYYFFYCRC